MRIVVPDEWKHLYRPEYTPKVIKIPDPRLRQVSTPVAKITKKTDLLIADMMRIMRAADGVGLAAPQLGIHQRVIVVAPEDMRPTGMINPVVVRTEGEEVGQEGCLSIPGLYGDVTRPFFVEVKAYDRRGREVVYEFEGMPARVLLHEIDHLDGMLFIDRVDPSTLHWHDPATTTPEA